MYETDLCGTDRVSHQPRRPLRGSGVWPLSEQRHPSVGMDREPQQGTFGKEEKVSELMRVSQVKFKFCIVGLSSM